MATTFPAAFELILLFQEDRLWMKIWWSGRPGGGLGDEEWNQLEKSNYFRRYLRRARRCPRDRRRCSGRELSDLKEGLRFENRIGQACAFGSVQESDANVSH